MRPLMSVPVYVLAPASVVAWRQRRPTLAGCDVSVSASCRRWFRLPPSSVIVNLAPYQAKNSRNRWPSRTIVRDNGPLPPAGVSRSHCACARWVSPTAVANAGLFT